MTGNQPSRKADHWPESYEEPCRFCGETLTYSRRGTGKPWRGSRDYWYAGEPHECPGLTEAQAAMRRSTQAVRKVFEK